MPNGVVPANGRKRVAPAFRLSSLLGKVPSPAPRFVRYANKPYFYNHAPFGWRSATLDRKGRSCKSHSRISLLLSELVFEHEHSVLIAREAQIEL
jgi:hypothetical protein